MMKIGILGTRGIPNAYGGFEQFAQYLATGLSHKNHDIYVYNSSIHPYQESMWKSVHIIHCKDPEPVLGTAGQFIYDYLCIKDANKRNFDIIFHLGYTSNSIWHALWSKNSINIINMDGLEWKRTKYNKYTRHFLRHAEALAVNHADHLVADSIGIKEYIFNKYQKNATYIPYGADIPEHLDPSLLNPWKLKNQDYYLVIARMEPENNIEMILEGFLASATRIPLLIIGSTNNRLGNQLRKRFESNHVLFAGAIFDLDLLNSLRHYSKLYFHGHSVGGTNPSLLEAMSCQCNIAAHNNPFNRAILNDNAQYFRSREDVSFIIQNSFDETRLRTDTKLNLDKIRTKYSWNEIINEYEKFFTSAIQISCK